MIFDLTTSNKMESYKVISAGADGVPRSQDWACLTLFSPNRHRRFFVAALIKVFQAIPSSTK